MLSRATHHLNYRRRRLGVWWRSRVFLRPSPQRAVWITSWQRSGSTWLAEQLASAPRTRLVYEPVNVPDGIVTGEQAALRPVPGPDGPHVACVLRALHGRVHGHWVDQMNGSHLPRRTVVKDVRGIELLSDVRAHATSTPIIVLLRHPFAVAASVVRLGWHEPSLSPQAAFDQEVERWCRSHATTFATWRARREADTLTLWTTYEEVSEELVGNSLDKIVDFLRSHDATWNALASHRLDPTQRSATDFASTDVAIEDAWRVQAYRHLVANGWDGLYSENGSQRTSINEFLASATK